MGISTTHLIILLVIIVLVFGTKKLKNIGTDLGSAVKGFKDGMKDGTDTQKAAESATPQVLPEHAESRSAVDVETKVKS